MCAAKSRWDDVESFDESDLFGPGKGPGALAPGDEADTAVKAGDPGDSATANAEDASDTTVTGRKLCVNCGRNLEGEALDQKCPACAHPIADSVYGDALLDTASEEAQRLYDASNLVFYPAMLLTILGSVALIATVVYNAHELTQGAQRVFDVGFLVAVISPAISMIGVSMLTRRHGMEYYAARLREPSTITWAGLLLGACLLLVVGAIVLGPYRPLVGFLVLVVWFCVPNVVFLNSLGGVMRRLQHKRLAKHLRLCGGWTVVLAVAGFIVLLLKTFGLDQHELVGPRVTMICLAGAGGIVLWGVALRLFVHARRVMRAIKH